MRLVVPSCLCAFFTASLQAHASLRASLLLFAPLTCRCLTPRRLTVLLPPPAPCCRSAVKRLVADGERYRTNHVEVLTDRRTAMEAELLENQARETTLKADIASNEVLIKAFRDEMFGLGWDDTSHVLKHGLFKDVWQPPPTPREGIPRGYRSVQAELKILREQLETVQTNIRCLLAEVCVCAVCVCCVCWVCFVCHDAAVVPVCWAGVVAACAVSVIA